MKQRFEPADTIIGVLGSGQLGRMFAIAARRLGYQVHIFSPDSETPAGQVADIEIQADFEDTAALRQFAESVDVVTLEFENIPSSTLNLIERHVPVRPGPHVLHTTQNRVREKTALAAAGFPVTDFERIQSLESLRTVSPERLPAILKTASWGYDGKGQSKIESIADINDAWTALRCDDAILETFVDFQCELSVVAARGVDGAIVCYDPIRNDHRDHILDVSVSPAGISAEIRQRATELAREVLVALDVIGVLCVEMFLAPDGTLIINELAPRPHNSGHLTMDAHVTCQFEQQVRAVCGLPLGSTHQLTPAAMANILGDCWRLGEPRWSRALASPDVKLHLYGKRGPRPGRKMGHLTAVAETAAAARAVATDARAALTRVTANSDAADEAAPDRVSTATR